MAVNLTKIPAPRTPVLDGDTNLLTPAWYRYLYNLFLLTGSGNNPTNLDELQYGPPTVTIDEVTQHNVEKIPTAPNDSALLSQIAEIEKQLNALKMQVQPQLGTLAPINIDWVPYLGFDTAPPWIGTTAGQFWFDSLTGSFNAKMGNNNITQQIGEEFFQYGKASAPISDVNLQAVYKTGVVGASGVITFAPAIAGIADPDQIIGIATESLALNAFGRVTTMGTVRGINTTGSVYGEVWADNDDIWYNPVTGGLTKTKPVAPNIKLQIGTIIKAGSGGSGSFSVNIGSSSTLGGTDSNVQLSAVANKDLLQYNGTYWTNVTPASVISGAGGAPVTKTANFTVAASETWIINNKSGSTCTATLPTASSYTGRILTFQNYQAQLLVSASSNVVPLGGGSAGTAILDAVAGNWATVVSDGTNWVMMQEAPNNVMLV